MVGAENDQWPQYFHVTFRNLNAVFSWPRCAIEGQGLSTALGYIHSHDITNADRHRVISQGP